MLLSEAIRRCCSFFCPCGACSREYDFMSLMGHLWKLGWSNGDIADWVAEQEKRLGIAEPTNVE